MRRSAFPVFAGVLALALVLLHPAAAGAVIGLEKDLEAKVIEVVDGDTVVLDRMIEGTTQVRLTGIQAPKLPLGREGFKEWPLAQEAKARLEKLVLNREVVLDFGGRRLDRHGRLLAHLFISAGAGAAWVQGDMIRLGMARVYTFADNRKWAAEMLALEDRARTARLGIWNHPFYAVRKAEPAGLARDRNTFQVIEGRIVDAANVRGVVYLNFGANWRDDFTVRLDKKTARLFKKEGLGPKTYGGRPVRVRGWLKMWNGPMIEVSHPDQIELLESR